MDCELWELRCSDIERGEINEQLVAIEIVKSLCTRMVVALGAYKLRMMYTSTDIEPLNYLSQSAYVKLHRRMLDGLCTPLRCDNVNLRWRLAEVICSMTPR
jgi:hypothetical protein